MQPYLKEIIFLASISSWLALAVGVVRFKWLDPARRILVLTPAAGALCEIAILILREKQISNLPLLHLFTLVQFLLLTWFFSILLKNHAPKWVFIAIAIVFTGFSIGNSLFIEPIHTYNSNALGLLCLFGTAFAIGGFYKIMAEMKIKSLACSAEFWINVGFLVYFCSSLFLMLLSNPLLDLGDQINYLLWGLRGLFVIFFYLSITMGFMFTR